MTGTTRSSCSWPQPVSRRRDQSRSASRRRPRRPSRPPSTGRAGRAPARPRSWRWPRSPTTRRATPSSPRRPASPSIRATTRSSSGPAAAAAPTSASRPRSPTSTAGRSTPRRPSAWRASSRRPGPSSRASPRVRPAELRKGPRGGGRDRDKMVGHVAESDGYYAREIGITGKQPDPTDRAGDRGDARRDARDPRAARRTARRSPGRTWTTRYAARRIAWHALDHAWEMEDRRETQARQRSNRLATSVALDRPGSVDQPDRRGRLADQFRGASAPPRAAPALSVAVRLRQLACRPVAGSAGGARTSAGVSRPSSRAEPDLRGRRARAGLGRG